ncbi:MAG: ABC transporter permease [Bacteroidetes bacterium]|nr:ABC transporter permease [Bacteroidota bacterium]MBU1720898.1 ABC transporter permease [Bacteroidota bacterium]
MFLTLVRIAIRNLLKQKYFSLMNIVGLTIGLSSFLLILLYINDENNYEAQNPKSDKIYRITTDLKFRGLGEKSSSCPFPMGPSLFKDYPELIRGYTRVFNNWGVSYHLQTGGQNFEERRFFFADSSVFDFFNIKFISGNSDSAFRDTMSMVITKSVAEKFFGDQNPIGKEVNVQDRRKFVISGVIEDSPANSHFRYNVLVNLKSIYFFYGKLFHNWIWNPFWTYVELREGVKPEQLAEKFPEFLAKNTKASVSEEYKIILQPLPDIHLNSHLDYEIEPNNKSIYIVILAVIGVFLLIIAALNYMNLSTAFASARAREIGIRKLFGSHRAQLAMQFLCEALIVTLISFVIALMVTELVLPAFNSFAGKSVALCELCTAANLLKILGAIVVLGILSGIYPAMYLSSINPADSLKSAFFNFHKGGGGRKVMVVVQFTISIALITGTLIASRQLAFVKSARLGFDPNNLVVIPISNTPLMMNYKSFFKELSQIDGIESYCISDYIPGVDHNIHEYNIEGWPAEKYEFYPSLIVKGDFLKVTGIQLLAGEGLSEKELQSGGTIITESMAKHQGWTPAEAIGKRFATTLHSERVVGVIEDFSTRSLHNSRYPFAINVKTDGSAGFTNYLILRINPDERARVMELVRHLWEDAAPNRPLNYKMLRTELDQLYREDDLLIDIASGFTIILTLISALGLAGVASFLTSRKTKEIAIRKVLGASNLVIFRILGLEFFTLVSVSFVLSVPLTIFSVHYWLSSFAFQEPTGAGVYFISFALAMMVALVSVSFNVMSALRMRPVNALKYE